MKPIEIIYYLYDKEGIRNSEFMDSVLDDNFELEWDSSTGVRTFNKAEVLNISKDLKENFQLFKAIILNQIVEENKIALHLVYQVTTIENPYELFDIAKIMIIWEFKNNKIIKATQFSKQF